MPRHTVRLLVTCSAFALALSSGAGAVEVNTHVNVPRINVPKPHITVPTVNNVPTVNLQHHRQSTGTNTLTNEKLNATTTTVNTPFVGPSNGGGSAGAKIIIESVGGSGTPTQVQQQNAAAAAAAAAQAAVQAAMAADVPGATRIPGPSQSGLGQPQSGLVQPALQPLQIKTPPPPCLEDCTLQEASVAANASLKEACSMAFNAALAEGDSYTAVAAADAAQAVQAAENASDDARNASFLASRSGTPAAMAQAAAAAAAAAGAWADAAAAMLSSGQPANSAAVQNALNQAYAMSALALSDAEYAEADMNAEVQSACSGGSTSVACAQATANSQAAIAIVMQADASANEAWNAFTTIAGWIDGVQTGLGCYFGNT